MNVYIDATDMNAIFSSLSFFCSDDNTAISRRELKAYRQLAKEIKNDFKKEKTSFSAPKFRLILLSVVYTYETLLDILDTASGDNASLTETQLLISIIEPTYSKFLPMLEELASRGQ